MSISQEGELDINCIVSRNIPKYCAGTCSCGDSVTYYTLLLSLGKLRWTATRKISQIHGLNESLQVPASISSYLSELSVEEDSVRTIALRKQKLSTYFKLLALHPCVANTKFLVFATSRIQVRQYFIVTGCKRCHLNGVYVYKEHQGPFSKYEKQDNPKCVLTTKFWMNKIGWYLIDEQEVVFYATGSDGDSEYPPVGIWEGADPCQSWGYIQVVNSAPTQVEIEQSLRRKLYLLHRIHIPRIWCGNGRQVSEPKTDLNIQCREKTLPTNEETLNIDNLDPSDKSQSSSKLYLAHMRITVDQIPSAEKLLNNSLNEPYEVFWTKQETVCEHETSICLNFPMLSDDCSEHNENTLIAKEKQTTFVDHRANTNQSVEGKIPLKLKRPCNIMIPQRPNIAPSVATDSDASFYTDCEGSIEFLIPKKIRKEWSADSTASLLPSNDSASIKWFSFKVQETDDSASGAESFGEDYYTSSSFRTSKSDDTDDICSIITQEEHIWNAGRALNSERIVYTKFSKTPILRKRCCAFTSRPDYVVCLGDACINLRKNEVLSLESCSLFFLPGTERSVSLIRFQPAGISQAELPENSNTEGTDRDILAFSNQFAEIAILGV